MLSHWTKAEIVSPAQAPRVGDNVLIGIPSFLRKRKIYMYLEIKATANNATEVKANFNLMVNNDVKGQLPSNSSTGGGLYGPDNHGVETFTGAGTNTNGLAIVQPDTMVLQFPKQWANVNGGAITAYLSPLYIDLEIDAIRWQIENVKDPNNALQGYYLYIGCLSLWTPDLSLPDRSTANLPK